jgi:hypothetical protein
VPEDFDMTEKSSRSAEQTVSFLEGVLPEELQQIQKRRGETPPPAPPAPRDCQVPQAVRDAQNVSALGLAFSGGGIRSATFNLGVTQALAERGLLPHVDYLSTVSGGGYIGTWLHGVIKTQHDAEPSAPPDEIFRKVNETLLTGIDRKPEPPEIDPISFLRKYSNYLTPRTGLFSTDTWVMLVIWIRNVLLNQLILAPVVASLAAGAMLLVLLRQLTFVDSRNWGFNWWAAAAAILGFAAAVFALAKNLKPIADQSIESDAASAPVRGRKTEQDVDGRRPKPRSPLIVILGVFIATLGVAFGDFAASSIRIAFGTGLLVVCLMGVIQVRGGFVRCFVARHRDLERRRAGNPLIGYLQAAWMSLASGAVTTALMWAAWRVIPSWQPWHVVAYAPALVAGSVIAGVMLLVGLMGADYPDAAREWTARIGARFAMVVIAWTALFALTIDGPPAVAELVHRLPRAGPAAVVTWIATTLGGVFAGRSPQTKNGEEKGATAKALEILVSVAPTLFLIGYVMATAAGTHALLARFAAPSAAMPPAIDAQQAAARSRDAGNDVKCCCCPCADKDGKCADAGSTPATPSPYATRYWLVLTLDRLHDGLQRLKVIGVLLGAYVVIALIASTRININEFSLHHFYKNRLVRCYLGASRKEQRKPNALTGFDPKDDFALAKLRVDPDASLEDTRPYYGPYPLINACLNLNAGSELAQQERKAASFVFTPAYCGFDPPTSRESQRQAAEEGLSEHGYRKTIGYSQPAGPYVGTTMAISGAAANPNWGYHTSGPMAFLLTVFNARLGWWLGNPRWHDASRTPGPVFALWYLLKELLGQTTGRTKYVNLSDGGHFDNLGLYELVRRRCRMIIVCDAEADPDLTFGSLGAAIRKCRADFGVEIDINPDRIRKDADGISKTHCVVGRIRYPEDETAFRAGMTDGWNVPKDDNQSDADKSASERAKMKKQRWSYGWILYLKSSLTGDEPADVIEYRSQFHEFPHQSTADQFFSESQFESYRRLGYHVLRSAFEGVERKPATEQPEQVPPPHPQYPLIKTFQALTRKWYAAVAVPPEAESRLANEYVELMEKLGGDKAAEHLFQEINERKLDRPPGAPPSPALLSAGMAIFQLMENVFTEFGFEHDFNVQNPRNAGWVETFRKWANSEILMNQIWPHIKKDYNPLFQVFVDGLRNRGGQNDAESF